MSDVSELKSLIAICYDNAQNPTLIRRCFSSLLFETILFISRKFPKLRDEIFNKRDQIFHGISESKFITILASVLKDGVKAGKIDSREADYFQGFIYILLLLRTLVDHFGGFKEELLEQGINPIRIYDPSKSSSKIVNVNSWPNELPIKLSRHELVKILNEMEKYLGLLSKL